MTNSITLVGRVTMNVELEKDEYGMLKDIATIVLAIPRHYKSEDGIYETDFIDVELQGNIAKNAKEYILKGDIIGVAGRLETYIKEDENGNKTKCYKVIADRLTWLSSKKTDINEVE